MAWQDKLFVKWGVRIAGFLGAVLGFAFREPVALALFGGYLIFEFWGFADKLNNHLEDIRGIQNGLRALVTNLEEKTAESLQYEYLNDSEPIWTRADNILKRARSNDEIRSTASTPNDFTFEKSIFERVFQGQLVYNRLICYTEPQSTIATGDHGFPLTTSIKGNSAEELLNSYFVWYKSFFQVWTARDDQIEEIDSFGMKIWHEALEVLALRAKNRFEVRWHGATLPSDYFILNPHEGDHWKAVVGFPRLQGEGMRSGFSTTHSLLAKDLGKNWQRLWEKAR